MKSFIIFALLFLAIGFISAQFANLESVDAEETGNRDGLIVARAKRALCGSQCSCGYGRCVYAPGYTGSFCCSNNYSFHCC
jgi:hypothetical protein